jgi:hypothetical protein
MKALSIIKNPGDDMLNPKAPRAKTLAACAALALGGMGASADAATTNGSGPLPDGRANAVYVDDIELALTTAAVPEPSGYAPLLAGLATVGAIARRRA